MGEIKFDIPQVREGGFYPESLEKGIRSERALNLTMAEMYIRRNYVEHLYQPVRLARLPNNLTKRWKNGETVHWEK